MQQHAATFFKQAEAVAGADLSQFVRDECDASLETGILAHGFLRWRCGDCEYDKLVTYSYRRAMEASPPFGLQSNPNATPTWATRPGHSKPPTRCKNKNTRARDVRDGAVMAGHLNQFLRIVRYWIPHERVVSPGSPPAGPCREKPHSHRRCVPK